MLVADKGQVALKLTGPHRRLLEHLKSRFPVPSNAREGPLRVERSTAAEARLLCPGVDAVAVAEELRKVSKGALPGLQPTVTFLHDLPMRMLAASAALRQKAALPVAPRTAALSAGALTSVQALDALLPAHVVAKLLAFQREGVLFSLRAGGRVLIADEMGCGKTVQALAVVGCYQEWPVLIVAPASLRDTWADAVHEWLRITDDQMRIIWKREDAAVDLVAATKVVVTSYNLVPHLEDWCKRQNFRVVVCDESHSIKSPTTKRTKAVKEVIKRCQRVLLLSGTPAMSRPGELYTQITALLPSAKVSAKEFSERYCATSKFGTLQGRNSATQDELNMVLVSTVMIRRLKRDVLGDLPSKMRQKVILTLKGKDAQELAALQTKLRSMSDVVSAAAQMGRAGQGVEAWARREKGQQLMEAYRATATLKVAAVVEYVETLVESNLDKCLLFAHHKEVLDALERACRKGCVKGEANFVRIDGDVPPEQRQPLVKRFQYDAVCRFAVLSIKAAGTGLTLTAASHVVFAEMTWVPGDMLQAEDRAHRIGQSLCVNCYYLLLRDSIDEMMWEILAGKTLDVGQMLDGQKQKLTVDSLVDHVPGAAPSRSTLGALWSQSLASGAGASGSGVITIDADGATPPLKQAARTPARLPVKPAGDKQKRIDNFFSASQCTADQS